MRRPQHAMRMAAHRPVDRGRRQALHAFALSAARVAAVGAPWVLAFDVRAQANPPPEVRAELPGATLRGSGRMTFFGLHVYDARLWTLAPADADDLTRVPLALELQYARTLYGRQIAERSLEEMRRLDSIDEARAQRWLAAMTKIFPDVSAGDRITGLQRPGEGARFLVNGELRGEVRDSEFARLFFGIWLSPRTSESRLRAELLGTTDR